jgi:hypothetical protein
MLEQVRCKLLFGPYRMPKCRVGKMIACRIRGPVRIEGITAAPMQWPFTFRSRVCRLPSVIVCGDLVRALRRESVAAIAYWWGVSTCTVWRWRAEIGVEQFTEGTRDLYRRWMPDKLDEEAIRKQRESNRSPEANAKRAAALRGRPMPDHVRQALLKANKGRKVSAETRRRRSEAWRPIPKETDWKPEEDALLGTIPDIDVSRQTGRTLAAVRLRRKRRGIANYKKRKPMCKSPRWTKKRDALLGTMMDHLLAEKLDCTARVIRNRRRKLGVTSFRRRGRNAGSPKNE